MLRDGELAGAKLAVEVPAVPDADIRVRVRYLGPPKTAAGSEVAFQAIARGAGGEQPDPALVKASLSVEVIHSSGESRLRCGHCRFIERSCRPTGAPAIACRRRPVHRDSPGTGVAHGGGGMVSVQAAGRHPEGRRTLYRLGAVDLDPRWTHRPGEKPSVVTEKGRFAR